MGCNLKNLMNCFCKEPPFPHVLYRAFFLPMSFPRGRHHLRIRARPLLSVMIPPHTGSRSGLILHITLVCPILQCELPLPRTVTTRTPIAAGVPSLLMPS